MICIIANSPYYQRLSLQKWCLGSKPDFGFTLACRMLHIDKIKYIMMHKGGRVGAGGGRQKEGQKGWWRRRGPKRLKTTSRGGWTEGGLQDGDIVFKNSMSVVWGKAVWGHIADFPLTKSLHPSMFSTTTCAPAPPTWEATPSCYKWSSTRNHAILALVLTLVKAKEVGVSNSLPDLSSAGRCGWKKSLAWSPSGHLEVFKKVVGWAEFKENLFCM